MPATGNTALHLFHVETPARACGPGCRLVVSNCRCGVSKRERILDGEVVQTEVKLQATWPWIDVRDLDAAVANIRLHAGVAS